jgi:hypothetical protein
MEEVTRVQKLYIQELERFVKTLILAPLITFSTA